MNPEWLPGPQASLWGLFASSFLSATLLPGGSEAVLFAVIRLHPDHSAAALALATLGNTLGGMSTYLLARLIPLKAVPRKLGMLRRWGSPALVLAWAPVVGDALCAAAGWLRINWLASLGWMALGKFARYLAVALGAGAP